jgi:hypothetical protein
LGLIAFIPSTIFDLQLASFWDVVVGSLPPKKSAQKLPLDVAGAV